MNIRILYLVATLLVVISNNVYAEIHVGYAPTMSLVDIDDPDGNTKNGVTMQTINAILTQSVGRDRLLYRAYYQGFNLPASTTNIGQNVTGLGFSMSGQLLLRPGRGQKQWRPWGGLGFGVEQNHYTLRHTVDTDGYLVNTYSDRSRLNYNLLANFSSEWVLMKYFTIGSTLQYTQPLGDGVRAVSFGLDVIY